MLIDCTKLYEPGITVHSLSCPQFESPSRKDAFCQVWLNLAQWFWRRRFFKNLLNVFSLFRNDLPLETSGALHLNKLESLRPRMLCVKFGWIGLVVLEKKMIMWIVYDDNDDGQLTNCGKKRSLRLRWAKKLNALHYVYVISWVSNFRFPGRQGLIKLNIFFLTDKSKLFATFRAQWIYCIYDR